jgi:hypothetical protein
MIAWTPENVARITAGLEPAQPRKPRVHVNAERIPYLFMQDVVRHMRDGAGIDRAMLLSGIDADDALTAWRTS